MFRRVKGHKGFTMVEVLFVAALFAVVVTAVVAAWSFAAGAWTAENTRMALRADVMNALETMKHDLRLSSLNYMVYFPDAGTPKSAVSMPVATLDSNGLLPLDSEGNIDWDDTVIYHLYTSGGESSLLRTVLYNRDNSLTREERYEELEDVVSAGTGSGVFSTDTLARKVEAFEISDLSSVIEFYEDSATPVKVGKVTFGMAQMTPGDHTIAFEITGKNDSSLGYDIGIDQIMIEPSGSRREAEYYASSDAPSGALTEVGGTAVRVYGTEWENNNYLEFNATGSGDYVAFTDGYDLWRESSFKNSSLNNVKSVGEEARMSLDIQENDSDAGVFAWDANAQVGDTVTGGRDGAFPGTGTTPVVIRDVVKSSNLDASGDMIRVSFKSSSTNNLLVTRAYITKRQGTSPHGEVNQTPGSLTVEEYHRHQQLFFKDFSGNITESFFVPAGGEVWSLWTAFPLRNTSDYLISMEIRDAANVNCKYWEGPSGSVHSYYAVGSEYSTIGGLPSWSSYTYSDSSSSFIVSKIDSRLDSGTVESSIFDTGVTTPSYSALKWSEYVPAGSDVKIKARSSSSTTMSGATLWTSISAASSTPASLSIGSGRYVQFLAELESVPFWKSGASTLSYPNYVSQQVSGAADSFPYNSGVPYVTGIYSTWVDDVEITWDPGERLVNITGYIARKNDHGQAKVLLDGSSLVHVLKVRLKTSEERGGREISEENYIEVYPRNTGK